MSIELIEIDRMITELDTEYAKDKDALRRVRAFVSRKSGSEATLNTPTPTVLALESPEVSSNNVSVKNDDKEGGRRTRTRGLWKACVALFPNLPDEFTRNDILGELEIHSPEIYHSMSISSIRGVFEKFIKEGYATLLEAGTAQSPSKYRKITSRQENVSEQNLLNIGN